MSTDTEQTVIADRGSSGATRGSVGAYARMVARSLLWPGARRWVNDRWLVRWGRQRYRNSWIVAPALRRQLAWKDAPVPLRKTGDRILVPLLETSHYQYYQILALAKALQLRGADVAVLVCDSALDGCELKNSRRLDRDQCLSCRMNQKDLLGFFGLEVIKLSTLLSDEKCRELRAIAAERAASFPARYEHEGVDLLGMTNDSVTRFYYGAVPEVGSPGLELHRRRYLYSALVGVEAAKRLHAEWRPTSLLGSMGVYSDWAPYVSYFKRHGIPYNLVTMAAFDILRSVTLNYWDFYTGTQRFDRWRASRAAEFLTAREDGELDQVLSARFAGEGAYERASGAFAGATGDLELAVDPRKRNVFLFANLAWDIGINYEGTPYDDVIEWVVDSVANLAGRTDTHLYVKPHPDEAFGSVPTGQGVADAIRARYPTLPGNVTIIPPANKVKPYDLFPLIDLGVVYNSTIGLEMILKGIPVVTAGAAPYGGHGFSREPHNRAEYAEALTGGAVPPRPDPRLVELFAYFYFIKTQLPWHLTRQVYFDDFKGYTFDHLEDLLPGKDRHLDHLCSCILDPDGTVIEAWE